jgi:hypothetical protein
MNSTITSLIFISVILFRYDAMTQTAAADNRVSESITFSEPLKGRGLYGVFEGRTPCTPVSDQLTGQTAANCDHLKWQIIFFRDSITNNPANFIFISELFGRHPQTGKWRILPGTKNEPAAIIYALDFDTVKKSLFLRKGDENVLFILDDQKKFLTGNQDFSYTLNRVQKVRRPLPGK